MAFYGKTWPIGLAPGMGINAFVAFGVVGGMGYTPQAALGAVLVAGVLFLIISLTPIRAWLINSIPRSLKLGIGAGIGFFLAIIGLEIMGVVGDHPVTLVTLGDLKNPLILLGCLAFVSMIVMEKMKIRGNIIIGILLFSVIAWVTGLAKFNGVVSSPPPMTYLFAFDLGAAFTAGMSTVIFTLLFIDFFDTAGTLTSVANVAGKVDKNGKVQELLGWDYDKDPSPIGPGILDIQDGPTRIDAPMVRKSWLEQGPGSRNDLRGIDPFIEVSWKKAEQLVADELTRIKNTYGNASIFGGSYGWASAGRFHHAQSQLHRFLNCIGGYTRSKFTYSFAAAEAMVPHILGSYRAYLDTCTSWDLINKNTELFVCFGGIPIKNGQISQGGTGNHYQRKNLVEAANSGIEFINISPLKSDLIDEVKGEWITARPNTCLLYTSDAADE